LELSESIKSESLTSEDESETDLGIEKEDYSEPKGYEPFADEK